MRCPVVSTHVPRSTPCHDGRRQCAARAPVPTSAPPQPINRPNVASLIIARRASQIATALLARRHEKKGRAVSDWRPQRALRARARECVEEHAPTRWAVREVDKILVLAHHDSPISCSATPDVRVRSFIEANLNDVLHVVAELAQPPSERHGKLVVDQQPHATRMTVWLVCNAA